MAKSMTVVTSEERSNVTLSSNTAQTKAFESQSFKPTIVSNLTIPIAGNLISLAEKNNSIFVVRSEDGSQSKAITSSTTAITSTTPHQTNVQDDDEDDDNIVISSSEILSDNRPSNYLSNSSGKQRSMNVVDINCSSRNNSDLLDSSRFAELDFRGSSSPPSPNDLSSSSNNNNNSNLTHYSNSRHILRILVVGLFGLVSLSLTTVYTIKFCLCGNRKGQHISSSFRRSCSLRRNFVIDVDQIDRSHFIHSTCSCSGLTLGLGLGLGSNSTTASTASAIASPEIPTISAQSNRLQSLFRPDFITSRYRISDVSAKCGPNLPQIGSYTSSNISRPIGITETTPRLSCDLLPAQNQSIPPQPPPSGLCQQVVPNLDRLYNYQYCHYHHQFNHPPSSTSPSSLLHPLLTTDCHCLLSNVDQFVSTLPSTITHLDNPIPLTSDTNVPTNLGTGQTNDHQIDLQQRPPTYHELFGNNQTESVGGSQVIGGATRSGQSEANNESSSGMSSARVIRPSNAGNQSSSTTIDHRQQQLQQDQKNLLVKLNLSKTKLLSAGDLMLLSKLIDVPIVVQQQQQQQDQQQQLHSQDRRQFEAGRVEETSSGQRAFVEILEQDEP